MDSPIQTSNKKECLQNKSPSHLFISYSISPGEIWWNVQQLQGDLKKNANASDEKKCFSPTFKTWNKNPTQRTGCPTPTTWLRSFKKFVVFYFLFIIQSCHTKKIMALLLSLRQNEILTYFSFNVILSLMLWSFLHLSQKKTKQIFTLYFFGWGGSDTFNLVFSSPQPNITSRIWSFATGIPELKPSPRNDGDWASGAMCAQLGMKFWGRAKKIRLLELYPGSRCHHFKDDGSYWMVINPSWKNGGP